MRCLIRPFNKTNLITVNAIFNPCLDDLLFIFQTVKIHVVYKLFLPVFRVYIFVNDRKSRTSHNIPDTFTPAQGFNYGGFSYTHFSMKCKYLSIFCHLPELCSKIIQTFKRHMKLHYANLIKTHFLMHVECNTWLQMLKTVA